MNLKNNILGQLIFKIVFLLDILSGIRIFCPEVLNDSPSVLSLLKANFQEVSLMMDGEKQKIITMRRNGAGYGQIAAAVGISINTVKSFCRQHGLAAKTATSVCEQCGRPVE